MSFGSGMSRQQTPIKAPPMQRTDQWGSILEAINNPSVLITGNTANSKIIEYYNQLKKENNAEYDKIYYGPPKKTNKEMEALGFKFYVDILTAGAGGGGGGGWMPTPDLFAKMPSYVPSEQELQEMRTKIAQMKEYQRKQQEQNTPTPSPTTTPITLRSDASIKARERLNEINNLPNPTTLELDEALKLFNLIEDIERPGIIPNWRLLFDEKRPESKTSTPDEFFPVRGFTPEEIKQYEFELGFNEIQNRTGLDVIQEEKTPKSKTSNVSMTVSPTQITAGDYAGYRAPSTSSSSRAIPIQTTLKPLQYEQILEFSTGKKKNKGINKKIIRQILQRLISDKRSLLPLVINDNLQSLLSKPPFHTLNHPNLNKTPLLKQKVPNSKIKTAIIERVINYNPNLNQLIINLITHFFPNTIVDFTVDNIINEIMNTNDMVNLSNFHKALLKALTDSAKQFNYPEWFIDMFEPIPMDVVVPEVEMAPSIRDEYNELLPLIMDPLVSVGIPPENAQEWALKLIESKAVQQIKYIYELGDWKGAIQDLKKLLVTEVGLEMNELANVIHFNPNYFLKLVYQLYVGLNKSKNASYITKIKAIREVAEDFIQEVPRQALLEVKAPAMTIEEVKELIQEDFKGDIVNVAGRFRIRFRNFDIIRVPRIILRAVNQIRRRNNPPPRQEMKYYPDPDDPDDDPDDDPYAEFNFDFDEEDIPERRDIFWHRQDPDPDPDDDPQDPEIEIFFRGRNRSIRIRTLILALLGIGATVTAIYKIIKRILAMEEHKLIEDNKNNNNNNSNNIENKMPDLARYKLAYLQLAQAYLQAQEDGKDEATLQKYRAQLIDLKNIIEKLSPSVPTDTTGNTIPDTNIKIDTNTPTEEAPDSIVNFNPELETIEGSGDGMLRAEIEDPNEVKLFLNTTKVAKEQQKMFNNFSKVAPGHGLGDYKYNGLARFNKREENLRYQNKINPSYNPQIGYVGKAKVSPSVDKLELTHRRNKNQPMMIPVIQGDFGRVQFEVDGNRGNDLMSNHFTRDIPNSNITRDNENAYSIYDPELALSRYRMKGTKILEPRMNGYDYAVPGASPSTQSNILISDRLTGYNFTPLMRDDVFNQQKVKIVKNNIDTFNQRITSSRH